MTDHDQGDQSDLRDLLTDAVADVEPGYALDEIRARTATAKRRWPYAAGGAVLAVAASFAAFAVLGNGPGPVADPGPVGSPTLSASPPSPSDSASATEVPDRAVAVYYLGDTPDGPRLYREFRSVPEAVHTRLAVVSIELAPLDPDYRTAWPARAILDVSFDGVGDGGLIQIELSTGAVRDRPADMDEATARLSVEQAVYTAQAAFGARAPVQFMLDGNPIDQVFGVPTSEPLANGPVLDTLAQVSLTTPTEGMVVDNDEPLVVEGLGNSFEGNIVTRVQRWEGTFVVEQLPAIAGMGEDKLFPFEVTFDLTDVPPGDYVVISRTDDPSGQGSFHTDSRRITVVD